jgi:hypothetical protein
MCVDGCREELNIGQMLISLLTWDIGIPSFIVEKYN